MSLSATFLGSKSTVGGEGQGGARCDLTTLAKYLHLRKPTDTLNVSAPTWGAVICTMFRNS